MRCSEVSASRSEVQRLTGHETTSLIPVNARFPRQGDIYEALEDIEVRYLTSWAAPFTGSGKGMLKKGERVVLDTAPFDTCPISVYASAIDYVAIENRVVSAAERTAAKYQGFVFSLKTVDLNSKFRLVNEELDRNS